MKKANGLFSFSEQEFMMYAGCTLTDTYTITKCMRCKVALCHDGQGCVFLEEVPHCGVIARVRPLAAHECLTRKTRAGRKERSQCTL